MAVAVAADHNLSVPQIIILPMAVCAGNDAYESPFGCIVPRSAR